MLFDANMTPRVTRCNTVRILPTPVQHAWLMRWFKDGRQTYNLAMARVLRERLHKRDPELLNLRELESDLVKDLVSAAGVTGTLHRRHHKLLRTPKVIRQQAVKSVISVLKRHHTMVNQRKALREKFPDAYAFKKPIKFNPTLKSKKMTTHDSISIEIISLKITGDDSVSLYKTFVSHHDNKNYIFRNLKTQTGLQKINKPDQDFKIHYNFGKFYLLLPETRPVEARVRIPDAEAVVAVDPGVRTPFTIYSPQGSVAEIGYNATKVLDKLLNRISRRKKRLQQVICEVQVEKETRFLDRDKQLRQRNRIRRAKRAYHEAEDKAKRVIKDFHYKAAHYLCQHYHTIILPHTSSHHWRVGKRLAAITKKRSMALRMGLFSSRLIQTSTKYIGSVIKRGSEAYTSKQCGACGTLNDTLGGSKKFVCKSLSCGATGDRDIHAARNILLRFLQD